MNKLVQQKLINIYTHIEKQPMLSAPWFEKNMFYPFYSAYKKYFEDDLNQLLYQSRNTLQPGNIIDVGAGIGYSSNLMAQYLTDKNKIFAFEPSTRNFKSFKNIMKAQLQENKVEIFRVPLGDTKRPVGLRAAGGHRFEGRVVLDPKSTDDSTIMQSIDDFCHSRKIMNSISIIKIDVEGFEHNVLKGARKTISRNQNVHIIFECSPGALEKYASSICHLDKFFFDLGFNLYTIQNRSLKPIKSLAEHFKKSDSTDYCNVLARSAKPSITE